MNDIQVVVTQERTALEEHSGIQTLYLGLKLAYSILETIGRAGHPKYAFVTAPDKDGDACTVMVESKAIAGALRRHLVGE